MINDDSNDLLPEKPTKSQLKRDMKALQEIGERLVALNEKQLAKISMDEELLEAVLEARTLKNDESKRRKLQYIGKLMRHTDPEPLKTALAKIEFNKQQNKSHFHKIEKWRDQLITTGDTGLQELMESYPNANRSYLRQLILKAKKNRNTPTFKGVETEIFRYLRELLEDE